MQLLSKRLVSASWCRYGQFAIGHLPSDRLSPTAHCLRRQVSGYPSRMLAVPGQPRSWADGIVGTRRSPAATPARSLSVTSDQLSLVDVNLLQQQQVQAKRENCEGSSYRAPAGRLVICAR